MEIVQICRHIQKILHWTIFLSSRDLEESTSEPQENQEILSYDNITFIGSDESKL